MVEILEGKNLVYSAPKRSSVLITKKDGPQEFDKALEARLVKEGVAVYAGEVATAPVGEIGLGAGGNIPSKDTVADGNTETYGGDDVSADAEAGNAEKPVYSTETDISELRRLLKECGMVFKPGMTKVKIVAMLDDHFADADDGEAPPALKAEDPIP